MISSLPVREVWIEIRLPFMSISSNLVTSREGSVDWNLKIRLPMMRGSGHFPWGKCGLKSPCNHYQPKLRRHFPWGKCGLKSSVICKLASLPFSHFPWGKCGLKWEKYRIEMEKEESLPVREVWIEIFWFWRVDRGAGVTSREGSVDWNSFNFCFLYVTYRHFPWGKCGLKYCCLVLFYILSRHFPWGKCGLKYIGSMPVVIFLFVTSREGSVDWNIAS